MTNLPLNSMWDGSDLGIYLAEDFTANLHFSDWTKRAGTFHFFDNLLIVSYDTSQGVASQLILRVEKVTSESFYVTYIFPNTGQSDVFVLDKYYGMPWKKYEAIEQNSQKLYFDKIKKIKIDDIKKLFDISAMSLHQFNDIMQNPTTFCFYKRDNIKIFVSQRLVAIVKKDPSTPLDICRCRFALKAPSNLTYLITMSSATKLKVKSSNIKRTKMASNFLRMGDLMEDTFYAMTDGQYGSYEGFKDQGGDFDYLGDTLGR